MDHKRFQLYGTTAHTAPSSKAVVRALFPEQVMSRFVDFACPPRSPDLFMCDLFLWGHLKTNVYIENPRTLE